MKSNALSHPVSRTRLIVNCGLLVALSVILKLLFEVYIPLGGFPSLRINLTAIPIILTGILFGPGAGFLVGAISDILCFAIKPGGPFFPGFTLVSALTGFLPGLLWRIQKKYGFPHLEWFNLAFIAGSIAILTVTGVFGFADGAITYSGKAVHPVILVLFAFLLVAFVVYPIIVHRKNVRPFRGDYLLFTICVTQILCSIVLNTLFLTTLYGQAVMVLLPARIIANIFIIPLYTILIGALLQYLPESLKRPL